MLIYFSVCMMMYEIRQKAHLKISFRSPILSDIAKQQCLYVQWYCTCLVVVVVVFAKHLYTKIFSYRKNMWNQPLLLLPKIKWVLLELKENERKKYEMKQISHQRMLIQKCKFVLFELHHLRLPSPYMDYDLTRDEGTHTNVITPFNDGLQKW